MFRDFAPKAGYFFKLDFQKILKNGPMFRDFGAKKGPMFRDFLSKIDPFGRYIPV